MSNINIETTENGFLVTQRATPVGSMGKLWVFETPEALANFVSTWGTDNSKKVSVTMNTDYDDSIPF